MSYDVKKKRKHKGSKIKKSFKLIDVKKAPRKKIVKNSHKSSNGLLNTYKLFLLLNTLS